MMATIVMTVYFTYLGQGAKLRTMLFATLIVAQWFSAQNCRSPTKSVFTLGVFKNRILWLVYVVDIILVAILFVFPPMTALFELMPIEPVEWLFVFLLSSIVLIVEEVRKRVASRLAS
jgi:Ca2+-transporting ATPase